MFCCEYCEIMKISFFGRAPHCWLYFSEILCDGKIFGRLWVQDWHFPYFFSRCFNFLHGPWLFRTSFHTKIFSKCNFCTHYNVGSSTTLIESLKFRNNSRIAETSHSNLLWKLWIWVFWILCFVIISLWKWSCMALLKIALRKKKSMQKFRWHWSMRHRENLQKRKCKVYRYKLQI